MRCKMGLNLKSQHLYEQRKSKTYSDKLSVLAKQYLNLKYKQEQIAYYSDESNFSKSHMGKPNPFLLELKNNTVQEIIIRHIVDALSKEALSILREEFTNRVCRVESDNIQVFRIDNNQAKLAIMHEDKLDILRASKSQLMTDEVFRFNNNRNYDADITVVEYLNEFCFEIVLEAGSEEFRQTKFVNEMKLLLMEFMKAYGAGIKQKYHFKSKSSFEGVVSRLEVRNEGSEISNSKIVRWVYKDSHPDDEDDDY